MSNECWSQQLFSSHEVCCFYNVGVCAYGHGCWFPHSPSPPASSQPPPCVFFSASTCKYGEDCKFSHARPNMVDEIGSLKLLVGELRSEVSALRGLLASSPASLCPPVSPPSVLSHLPVSSPFIHREEDELMQLLDCIQGLASSSPVPDFQDFSFTSTPPSCPTPRPTRNRRPLLGMPCHPHPHLFHHL